MTLAPPAICWKAVRARDAEAGIPTIAEARAFELVRGTHFALFSLLAGLELIPTLLMSVLKQNKPQKKKHGFKTRMKTKDGRKIIKARRRKGRKQLGYGQ